MIKQWHYKDWETTQSKHQAAETHGSNQTLSVNLSNQFSVLVYKLAEGSGLHIEY
jgi:hypothetical protein